MTRITPFDSVFGRLADEWFHDVRREAAAAHKDSTDRAQFASVPAVQRLLAEIEAPELLQRTPAAAAEYLVQLYVAYRFWDAGKHVYPITRDALSPPPAPEAAGPRVVVPHGACYLQLPEQWIWAQIDSGQPHEPVDGIFVADSATNRELTAVAVLGLRRERDGFSQVAVTVPRHDLDAAPAGVRSVPFAPTMEGGEQAGFRSLASTAELLYLIRLATAHVAAATSH